MKPPIIKRKKIEAGHYTYGGYNIRKIEREGNRRIKYAWETEKPPGHWLGANLVSSRTISLSRAIATIEQGRIRIWSMVHQIEAEREFFLTKK